MGKVVFDISMSLDGFVTASDRSPQEPMGEGGQRLHDWAFGDDRNQTYLAEIVAGVGAVIAGRETYDTSVPWWGPDGPTGAAQRPVFVVTHEAPADPPDGVYTFVTDGIHSALQQARTAARDKDVEVMGGASIGRQYLAAGLVDEILIHLVPVLFGSGTPLFHSLDIGHVPLEPPEVTESPTATHLRYHVATRQPGRGPVSP